jgi:hypothetical protein
MQQVNRRTLQPFCGFVFWHSEFSFPKTPGGSDADGEVGGALSSTQNYSKSRKVNPNSQKTSFSIRRPDHICAFFRQDGKNIPQTNESISLAAPGQPFVRIISGAAFKA